MQSDTADSSQVQPGGRMNRQLTDRRHYRRVLLTWSHAIALALLISGCGTGDAPQGAAPAAAPATAPTRATALSAPTVLPATVTPTAAPSPPPTLVPTAAVAVPTTLPTSTVPEAAA